LIEKTTVEMDNEMSKVTLRDELINMSVCWSIQIVLNMCKHAAHKLSMIKICSCFQTCIF